MRYQTNLGTQIAQNNGDPAQFYSSLETIVVLLKRKQGGVTDFQHKQLSFAHIRYRSQKSLFHLDKRSDFNQGEYACLIVRWISLAF